jgi:hypothetical protein
MQQADIARQAQNSAKLMPACAIQQHDGVCARCDVTRDLGQMQVHCLGIGFGQDKRCADAAGWTDSAKDVGPVVAPIARCGRPGPLFAPDVGQAALLADARFILPPEFDWLAASLGRDDISDQRGKVFLCASCAEGSACG